MTQSSTDDGDLSKIESSSTVISSTQVVTTTETKQEVITTSSTTNQSLLERANGESDPAWSSKVAFECQKECLTASILRCLIK